MLDGGKYELWQVGTDGAEDKLLETFSTVNGVKVFEDLAYGTYYVKECSAPSGYLITGNGLTPGVQLKKSEPHKSISLVNKQFKDGRITIIKKDEKAIRLQELCLR